MKKEGKGAISYIVLAAVLVALFVFALNVSMNNSNITGNVASGGVETNFAIVGSYGDGSSAEGDVADLIKGCRKAQRHDVLLIYRVDNAAAVYTISGEPVGVP